MSLTLIDKQDNFELIRDQIAAILVTEVANQQALATAAAKDPNLWKLRVFTERFNPWEEWLNGQTDKSPIVNIWYDSSNFNRSKSNQLERQCSETVYNIDIYGYGIASDDPTGGHNPGDQQAAFTLQRGIRLVRNILMAAENTHLKLQGLVMDRWPQSINAFQIEQNGQAIQQVQAARIALAVSFNEFSPQVVTETLEFLSVQVKRVETGEIYLTADYDYTI